MPQQTQNECAASPFLFQAIGLAHAAQCSDRLLFNQSKHKFYMPNTKFLICVMAALLPALAFSQQENKATRIIEQQHHDLTERDFSDDSPNDRYKRLTESDYQKVANELGIEVAAIKALSKIEAGNAGFVNPGKPTINFDLWVFKSMLRKNGHTISAASKKAPIAFARVNAKRFGGYGKAQWARLNDACRVNRDLALQSTFWGMFQIGGFNYKKCDCSSAEEMATLMKQSEAMQLELFARFIRNCGLVKYIKAHNWYAFSKGYNGNRVVKGYAARIAREYARFKKQ